MGRPPAVGGRTAATAVLTGLAITGASQAGPFQLYQSSPDGACGVFDDGYCFGTVGSGYPNNANCVWHAAGPPSGVVLTVQRFSTEASYDVLYIDGSTFSGTLSQNAAQLDGFQVPQDTSMQFDTDGSVTSGGFRICDRNAPSAQVTPAPSSQAGEFTLRTDTPNVCTVDNQCFGTNDAGWSSHGYQCTFVSRDAVIISATQFTARGGVLTVNGVSYTGDAGPARVAVAAGATIVWDGQERGNDGDFRVCIVDAPDSSDSNTSSRQTMEYVLAIGLPVLVFLGLLQHRLALKRRRQQQQRFAVFAAVVNPNDELEVAQPVDPVHNPEFVPPPPYSVGPPSQPGQSAVQGGAFYPQQQPLMPKHSTEAGTDTQPRWPPEAAGSSSDSQQPHFQPYQPDRRGYQPQQSWPSVLGPNSAEMHSELFFQSPSVPQQQLPYHGAAGSGRSLMYEGSGPANWSSANGGGSPQQAPQQELPLTASQRDSVLESTEAEHADALEIAYGVVEEDKVKYCAAYAEHLATPNEARDRDSLDDLMVAIALQHDLTQSSPKSYVWSRPGTRLRQPDVGAPVSDWRTVDSAAKGGYISRLFALYDKAMPPTDALLRVACERSGAEFVIGPRKKSERLFEKARIAYECDLQRVTDFERRSVICADFAQMADVVRGLPQGLAIHRIKNRFARVNESATESGGYRDLQMVVVAMGGEAHSPVLFELQFHLRAFYALKSKVAASVDDGGQTGHERYIEFRGIKEQAEFNYRKAFGLHS